ALSNTVDAAHCHANEGISFQVSREGRSIVRFPHSVRRICRSGIVTDLRADIRPQPAAGGGARMRVRRGQLLLRGGIEEFPAPRPAAMMISDGIGISRNGIFQYGSRNHARVDPQPEVSSDVRAPRRGAAQETLDPDGRGAAPWSPAELYRQGGIG